VRVLIAGGGTGGHLFPGIALAEEVTTRHHKNSVVFVGTDRGLESRVVPASGYKLEIIPARGLKGMGFFRLVQGILTLPVALIASWRILRKYRPDVVVGVGGYASFPVVFCAWLQRVPTAVQEQNALPGLTNRILGRIVKVVFIAFEEARRYFPEGKSNLIGNPIRAKLTDNFLRSRAEHSKFTVLVFGGSLGAKRVNALMLEALDLLGDLKEGMRFVHQTGRADLEAVKQGYTTRGFDADVVEFIDDMSSAYATADLVVCRAGATTVAELTVCKKAAILIPYPYATDNHQEVNARSLVEAGAALMFREAELTGQILATNIRGLKENPDRLRRMEKQAGLLGRPEAAKELADVCVDLMVRTWGPHGRNRPDKEQKKGKEAA
jgi:UDP-N-acetylglucosamine--N-acetylmuramyl-(pentapeptide) pyrophosphoryl-undecaprenol N-acetylglucosamine transferase